MRTLRLVLAAGAFAVIPAAPAALHAQAPAADSLAFPRQFVQWVLSSQGDSALAHAGPELREAMKSAEAVNAMAGRIQTRFGADQGTVAEIQFDKGPLKVYVLAKRYETAPEPGAWVVAYDPATKVVSGASFSALSNVKSRYPEAPLP